jgi:hypothetical protein
MPALPLARSLTLFVNRVIELISPSNEFCEMCLSRRTVQSCDVKGVRSPAHQ